MFKEIECFRIADFISLHNMQHQEKAVSARLVRAQFGKTMNLNYRPQMKLWEGNVFTGICLFTGGGVGTSHASQDR